MGMPRFTRPKTIDGELSPNLYVANCGPAVGISYDMIKSVFSSFGQVKGVYAADESGVRVIVSYSEVDSAQAALTALNGHPCPDLGGRSLHIRFSVLQPPDEVKDSIPVSLVASEVNIPGLYLLHDFVSAKEEQELLAAVDERPWKNLSKRRVQHYGYEFRYETRNVDTEQKLGQLPSFVSSVVERISTFPGLEASASVVLDQLTVNEYPRGVGLSPHIDTHSAFEGLIFSLSLAGPCIMEFRRYSDGSWDQKSASNSDIKVEILDNGTHLARRAIYLPPRSMLLLSGEARYAWQHYIPHHKIDMVNDNVVRRGSRRVSFTLRKVREGPCQCEYPEYCDSQS
ncbi:alkylated DNA repair protein ALKBH8 homolog isoform X2 [Euphorbia lathyris]|uniref:alkylated DNA repair protein ALKBH8 homolog isoform X2 n=1 Tax=Euphorbia lathyris TaxID=212925 RepID=UPI0033132436